MRENLISKISELKKKRNALILAHLYQPAEIQQIADFTGDSLDLSIKASKTSADVIVFCGVHFMAETAAILSPQKQVLLPAPDSGCPMADMIDAESLKKFKAERPGAKVITYVNSSAAVKAESDVCCTSSNALDIVKAYQNYDLIFTPDINLGKWVSKMSGKEMSIWNGCCPLHACIFAGLVEDARAAHPNAEVLVHPECRPEVTSIADKVMSTSQMCRYANSSKAQEFIIGTEVGIMHRLTTENPGKKFYPLSAEMVCQNMKKTTLEKIVDVLTNLNNRITVEESMRLRAYAPLEKMLELSLSGNASK